MYILQSFFFSLSKVLISNVIVIYYKRKFINKVNDQKIVYLC